ncbi:hypothetical protein TNCV_1557311 [Trichonephila clavipes]|nr:hypothetical protein TNCV_1557311 [Trichonephila clavipes]
MEEALKGYGRTTKQQVNAQDTDTPLGSGRSRSSRWIQKKWPGFLRYDVLLLEDNARPHSATAMQNHIATLGWKRLGVVHAYTTTVTWDTPPAATPDQLWQYVEATCCGNPRIYPKLLRFDAEACGSSYSQQRRLHYLMILSSSTGHKRQ